MKALLARRAGQVKRYHQFRLLHEETVAEHSFNVVNLVLLLTEGNASAALLAGALTHDMGEYVLGDIPAPIKRNLGATAQNILDSVETGALACIHRDMPILSEEDHHTIKVADYLDGFLKCQEEMRLGNVQMTEVCRQYYRYLNDLMAKNGQHDKFINEIIGNFPHRGLI